MSREELEAEVLRLRSPHPDAPGEAFGRKLFSTPAKRDELFAAVEKTRLPMILTDPNLPDDPIVFANRAFQELSGYDSDELLGRNCRFLQGPGTDPGQIQDIRDALAAKRDTAIDIVNYKRDGTPFLNELFISPILDRDGHVLYHFGSQVDVTRYRDAGRQLAANERRQRAVFDSAVDFAIVVTDRDGLVTDWNSGAERVFGWTAEEMRGRPADRFFTPEDRAEGCAELEMRLAREEGRASDERWHVRKDGSRFWASGEMMPLLDEVGGHFGFTKIARDRTAEHLAGKALADAEARLRRAQEAGGVGLFTVRLSDNVLEPTPEFCRLYGLPERESYPSTAFEGLVVPEDAHLVSTAETRSAGAPPARRRLSHPSRRRRCGALDRAQGRGRVRRGSAARPVFRRITRCHRSARRPGGAARERGPLPAHCRVEPPGSVDRRPARQHHVVLDPLARIDGTGAR